MPEIVIRSGDELVERISGSSANIIRTVSSVTSNIVYFQDGRHETVRTIQRSGKWSKLETIRGTHSVPDKGDTVHFRDERKTVFFQEANRTKFTDSTSVPSHEIHYDVETNEFWHMSPSDIRAGDVVIHGPQRLKVEKVLIATAQIMFPDGHWIATDKIHIDTDDRSFYISELDKVEPPTIRVPKAGDEVVHKGRTFKIDRVSEDKVYFEKGAETPLKNLEPGLGVWYFKDRNKAFFDILNPGSPYWCLSAKDADELTEKVKYASALGYKLWGPTVVKGDHFAQAVRR